jgi:hypothetical protein
VLPFVVPSSVESLARIWGLGARLVGMFTVVVSILPQSSGADRYGQASLLVGHRSGAERRWIEADQASSLGCLAGCWCSGCGADRRRNVSSARQSETIKLPQVPMHKMQAFAICRCHAAAQSRFCLRQVSVSQAWQIEADPLRPERETYKRLPRPRPNRRRAGSRVGERQPQGALSIIICPAICPSVHSSVDTRNARRS